MTITDEEDAGVERDAAVEHWGSDRLFFTEAGRGGPLPWRVGEPMLEGDALGPTRHAHDGAAEYYYMFSGSAHVETGGVEFVLEEGELGYIPPDAPHNFTGPASDADACLFCVVGPNLVNNKWRLGDFKPGSEDLRMAVTRPFDNGGEPLPGGGTLTAEAIVLSAGDPPRTVVPEAEEIIYVVCEGALDIAMSGGLGGTIERGSYVHVREGVSHQLSTSSSCKVLRMNCGFAMWEGVPLAGDAP
jgi:mannose-6-phosphate isomerase-like protein (cupin superfamily)